MAKILVVEDDRFLLNAYKIKLNKAGFDVSTATNGEEALQSLETVRPDLILLDLILPQKDGFYFLQQYKQKFPSSPVPVIVLSNLGQQEDIARALSLGASYYAVKSDISLSDLVSTINGLLSKSSPK